MAAARGSSQDRADVFARGEAAVLVVADGAGGIGTRGGDAADVVLDRVRGAVLDADFDLLAARRWERAFSQIDTELVSIGETTAVVVVLVPGMVLVTACGDSEAWCIRPGDVERITASASRARLGSGRARPSSVTRGDLDGRLVAASDGLFRHVAAAKIVELARTTKIGGVADGLVALARLPSGELADDIAVLVAER